MKTKKHNFGMILKIFTIMILLCMSNVVRADWTSENVTMRVGETKKLYLPYSVTALYLKSVSFYSASPTYVVVKSHTNTSVTVEAKKAFSSPVIVRCDYTYYVLQNGYYVYGGRGAHDYYITVEDIPVIDITLPSSKTVYVGEREYLTPTVYPSNATSELTWNSSNYSTINVDQNGSVLAQTTGNSEITVRSSNGVSASCLVTAIRRPVNVTSVSVTPSTYTINEGDTYTLHATVLPNNATDKTLTWYSTNPNIVRVDDNGVITGVSSGTATIKAMSHNGKIGSCFVYCKKVTPNIVLSDMYGVNDIPSIANVTYERVLYSGWNSFCVPFAISKTMIDAFCTECKIAVVSAYEIIGDQRYISVEEVEYVGAGTPCLIYAPNTVTCNFTLNSVSLRSTPNNSTVLKGCYTNTVVGENVFKLTDDGYSFGMTRSNVANVAPFRAYIQFDEEPKRKEIKEPIIINGTSINLPFE